MPLPAITDTIRASVEGVLPSGHAFANVMHFRKTPILTYTGAVAILDPLLLALYVTSLTGGAPWRNNASTGAHLTQFRYTPLDGVTATFVTAHANAGIDGGEVLPAMVALVASMHTPLRGRSHRGRSYWCGYTEAANGSNGQPAAAMVTNTQTQWNGFLASLAGTGLALVVASYRNATAEDVTSVNVRSAWNTQRRRLR